MTHGRKHQTESEIYRFKNTCRHNFFFSIDSRLPFLINLPSHALTSIPFSFGRLLCLLTISVAFHFFFLFMPLCSQADFLPMVLCFTLAVLIPFFFASAFCFPPCFSFACSLDWHDLLLLPFSLPLGKCFRLPLLWLDHITRGLWLGNIDKNVYISALSIPAAGGGGGGGGAGGAALLFLLLLLLILQLLLFPPSLPPSLPLFFLPY